MPVSRARRDGSGPDELVDRLRAAGCVFAEEEAALLRSAAGTGAQLAAMARRRIAGEPLEQVLGWVQFAGWRIAVEPGVFVPRRRTESLLREAEACARGRAERPLVVDLCCGCGAVGAVLARRLPGAQVHAVDVDPAAVRCARRNLAGVGTVHEGDLYGPLPARLCGRVDLVVANAPYVPSAALPLLPREARDAEPRTALDGGADGLAVLRRVVAGAPPWLAPGGFLVVECAAAQVAALLQEFEAAGLAPTVRGDDEVGSTVVVGTAPEAG